ncbi:hypothetical protein QBE52_19160 [Clostridiaceae bacterium 35-E11]
MFKKIYKAFLKNQWEMVFSTQDVEEYAKIKGMLMNNNIEARTKIINRNVSSIELISDINRRRSSTYNILVKVEEVDTANHIIHHEK